MFKPDEKKFKFKQSIHNKEFLSQYVFPSESHYPRQFNTCDTRIDHNNHSMELADQLLGPKQETCAITGLPAKYRDPLTNTPYANGEAFKIIRERFFHREEDKLFIRLQVINDLAEKKKKQLAKFMKDE